MPECLHQGGTLTWVDHDATTGYDLCRCSLCGQEVEMEPAEMEPVECAACGEAPPDGTPCGCFTVRETAPMTKEGERDA